MTVRDEERAAWKRHQRKRTRYGRSTRGEAQGEERGDQAEPSPHVDGDGDGDGDGVGMGMGMGCG